MIRAMVVDDSPLVRKIAGDILSSDPAIEVVATAANAEFALNKLEREAPDVITMDIEMPGLDGVEAIRRIMARRPTPVVVLSSHARDRAELTLQALEAGAIDFVLKPSASLSGGLNEVAAELREKVRAAAQAPLRLPPPPPVAERKGDRSRSNARESRDRSLRRGRNSTGRFDLVAIGTSTGGPIALRTVLTGLPLDFPLPVVVVQHMPPVFTKAFADRLNACCELSVKEAEEGDALLPGRALIAPGDFHMTVRRTLPEPSVSLSRGTAVSGHRPSVDVLMGSVAHEFGSRGLGLIMTGMGRDGADGIAELHRRGGFIIAQDRESSVIFGMNREVIREGNADLVSPLSEIAQAVKHAVSASGRGDIR